MDKIRKEGKMKADTDYDELTREVDTAFERAGELYERAWELYEGAWENYKKTGEVYKKAWGAPVEETET